MPRLTAHIAVAAMLAASAAALPPAPIRSADGCFAVVAASGDLAARANALNFAEDVRAALRRATGWELKPGLNPILIALETEGVAQARHTVFISKAGAIRAQIEVPAGDELEALPFAREIVAALARVELARHSPPGRSPNDFPEWFIDGLARQLVVPAKQEDFEYAWSRWSRGRLEPIATLCEPGGLAHGDAAVSSQVVAWLVGHGAVKDPFVKLLEALGGGEKFSARLALECFTGASDPVASDADWDFWMANRALSVLEPGTTPPNAVRRFRAQLLTWPCDYQFSATRWRSESLTPEEMLALSAMPEIQAMAAKKAMSLRMAAIGRDATLRNAAGYFVAAFAHIARGETEAARASLFTARRLQQSLEAAAAAGTTL